VFVLSSLWEGLPTVLIEALFTKTPVITTDCLSGPREIITDKSYTEHVPVPYKTPQGVLITPPDISYQDFENQFIHEACLVTKKSPRTLEPLEKYSMETIEKLWLEFLETV
jgi:glycosyltransferase involved in cell wall biosynthesis